MEPSSANTGFIQQQPIIKNQFHEDVSLQRIANLYLPPSLLENVSPEISRLGDAVLTQQIFDWITDSERNTPYLRGSGRDAFGRPKQELIVTEGWRKLQEFGFANGVVAINYDTPSSGPYSRLIQFIRCHLWEASCANTLCPAAMQDGAARLLQRHLTTPKLAGKLSETEKRVFQNAYDHLTSRDPAYTWTSGQWMTERTGGSDVSQTETVAVYDPFPSDLAEVPLASKEENIPLGPWSISGFKWFSSATDSQMTILLAKTRPGMGVSAFFAPMRRWNPALVSSTGAGAGGTELNGITISRLKNKFGTVGLPTAELELKNMRGWLIGKEGEGIKEISTILNITRVHTTVSSMGYLGRGIGVAKAYALVREAGVGKGRRLPLYKHPLHMRTLADLTAEYHGLMLLTFYTLYILGLDEHRSPSSPSSQSQSTTSSSPGTPQHPLTPPPSLVSPLLRTLSSLHKSFICHSCVPLTFGCMESLGGLGYLVNSESEHLNLSRIFRDACVGAIWEGTTDVLAGDTVRALKHPTIKKEGVGALGWLVQAGLAGLEGSGKEEEEKEEEEGERIRKVWEGLKKKLKTKKQEELLPEARGLTHRLAEVLIAVLWVVDARVRPGREVEGMKKRWMAKHGFGPGSGGDGEEEEVKVEGDGLELDLAIVYGEGGPKGVVEGGGSVPGVSKL
ncbi:acyl-CoA dehydrogenase/oxidase [Neurospora tetraspora]|uniref:Acyl-CoA dehydrogenase/oxidase n=1 Tax=Neurospora tetraspora TaxID=94610 RepID=A0AAE0JLE8_9PEZI|nr:acyl-CoA dehydrogenase/oxidase [Neurospora tetraspora]